MAIFMFLNKTVLLRERNRHTARRVASARYAGGEVPHPRSGRWVLPHPRSGGYYPIPGPGGTPSQVRGGVLPHPRLRGYPPARPRMGYPPARPGMGYPPARPGMGYPPLTRPGMGYVPLPQPDLRWGTPSPAASVDRNTDSCQNITFPRTTSAGGKNFGKKLVKKYFNVIDCRDRIEILPLVSTQYQCRLLEKPLLAFYQSSAPIVNICSMVKKEILMACSH